MAFLAGVAQKVSYYYVPKFEIQVDHKKRIIQSLYKQETDESNSNICNETKENFTNRSRTSMFSEDTMDISFSATERGYLSDVSNAASPSGKTNTTNHNRRRIRHSDSNIHRINNGSVSDTDDDNNNVRRYQFERKPPKSKSLRKHAEQHSLEESKVENRSYNSSYNDHKKRFSWTDSGISSSIGTGPHTLKSLYSEPLPNSLDRTPNIPETKHSPLLKNIVGDTCNAVNQLKDLQKSLRKAHLEQDLCRAIANTNTIITNPKKSLSQDCLSVQIKMEVNASPDVIVTEEDKTNYPDESKEKKKCKIEDKENERRHSNYVGCEDAEKDFDIQNTKKCNRENIKRKLSCERTRSKSFISGLKKVASHFKPTFLMNTQSKDVTAEFSFAKRKNDEDTMKELQTITSRFRNEVNHLHNASIETFGLDEGKIQLDEENIQNILLEKLSMKPSKNMTFIQRVFSRSRSYKAKPFKKNNKRKSLCENVFISPCYADTYSPSIDNNNHIYKTITNSRKRVHCSLSTEEYPYIDTANRSLTPNEELGDHHDGIHAKYIIDQQDIRLQGSNSRQLFRVHSLSYMRETDDIYNKSQIGNFVSTNNCNGQLINMDIQQHIYSFSSSDLHAINNCEEAFEHESECEECVYSDYLDYLKFRRFRKSSRSDVHCRWPHETYDDNGYGSHSEHQCQCGLQNSGYPQQEQQIQHNGDTLNEDNRSEFPSGYLQQEQQIQHNGDTLNEDNRSEFPSGDFERTTITSEPLHVSCDPQGEETTDTKYGTYV